VAAAGKAAPPPEQPLTVKVSSSEQVHYEGGAKSVSAINAAGAFDILAGHISFFSLLTHGNVAVNTGGELVDIPISHGILHVRNDLVTVFIFGLLEPDPVVND
jgi:F0F1-type ATP synthase epsilon subunit